jgi:hypothetical protein
MILEPTAALWRPRPHRRHIITPKAPKPKTPKARLAGYVQLAIDEDGTVSSPQSASFSSNVTQGDLIYTVVGTQGGNPSPAPVFNPPTDSLGTQYVAATGAVVASPTNHIWMQSFYGVAPSGGANTVQQSWSGSVHNFGLYGFEISGVNVYSGGAGNQKPSGSTASCGPITMVSDGIIIGVTFNTLQGLSAGPGFTLIEITPDLSGVLESGLFNVGTYSPVANLSGSQFWGMVAAGFYGFSPQPNDPLFFSMNF